MEVLSCPREEVAVQVVGCRGSSRKLLLHDRNQLRVDLIDLVPSEKVGDLSRGEHIVDVLQEAFILDLIVGEEEGDALALLPSGAVEHFQVLQKVVGVVGAGQLDLEGLVASNEGGQASQALLAGATHANQ